MKQDYFLSLKEQVDIHGRRSVVLRALRPYLCEDDSKFLKTWDVTCEVRQKWMLMTYHLAVGPQPLTEGSPYLRYELRSTVRHNVHGDAMKDAQRGK
ncbi:hypothetical protein L3Q82_017674 [Scortum barcoo]|uniref:Uncharacterized protein n=1 Tax=Scortum barcoo TaxID=214431 RepID=A0ACB8VM21_9TELE|nr:hypothetical protein L3Q82_017674 [Scortum barcoo]